MSSINRGILGSYNGISSLAASDNIQRGQYPIKAQFAPKVQAAQNKNDESLVLSTFGKVKNYMKRLGLALLGIDEPSKEAVAAYSIPSGIQEESENNSNEVDPMLKRWPSQLLSNSNPPARANITPNLNLANQEFRQVMEEMNTQAEQEKAALETIKESSLNLASGDAL